MEKEVGASQMANGSEHGHKSLLGFLFKSDETNAQWSQGNWLKVTQSEGASHGMCMLFHSVGLYAFPWWSVSVGTSCPLSCPCSLLTKHVYTWTHRYPWPSGGRGWQNSAWPMRATLTVSVLCLYYPLPQQHAEIPVDAPWKASIFYPQDGIQKLPHHCPLFTEWQRTLLCDLVSQGTIHLKSVCTQC